jgi:hypothetical protein
MIMTKLKTITLVLLAVGVLGSGAGLLAQRAAWINPATRDTSQQPAPRAGKGVRPDQDALGKTDEPTLFFTEEEDKKPAAQDKGGKKFDLPQISGKVAQVVGDGKGLAVEVHSKPEGTRKVDVKITDQTRVTFGNVGPKEARLTEGYHADVWLDRDSKDVAARVYLRGKRNPGIAVENEKLSPPQLVLRVAAVEGDGKGVTLEQPGKGEHPGETVAVKFTEKTRILFANVARDEAKPAKGQQARVWLDDSRDTARAVKFVGDAEGKPPEGKGKAPAPDLTGRVIGLSANGKVLTAEVPAAEKGQLMKAEIKLSDATKESYHGVAAGGAKPTAGDQVQVWLAEGSPDTAARVRVTRKDPRKSVFGRVASVSADGGRITVEAHHGDKGGETPGQEIKITAQTRLVFFNVGPGAANPAEGDHVSGWLAEGSKETAEELMVTRPQKAADKPTEKKEK